MDTHQQYDILMLHQHQKYRKRELIFILFESVIILMFRFLVESHRTVAKADSHVLKNIHNESVTKAESG
jgi:hypothetical protein